ncbi:MAG: hypothetical protein IPK68_13515 [Bdellovibrionales bacterium]|nr:hypothetical protein [Bdellovibrionales bacterium]
MLIDQLDLLGSGSRAKMPPKDAGWKLDAGERALLTAWLAGGAKAGHQNGDTEGQVTWSNPTLQEQLRQKLKQEGTELGLRPTYGYTAKRRVNQNQLLATYLALANELGNSSPEPLGNFDYQNFRLHNLETGEFISNPTVSYARATGEMANRFQRLFGKNLIQNLGFIEPLRQEKNCLSVDLTCAEMEIQKDFDSNMHIILSLYKALQGVAAKRGVSSYLQCEEYVRRYIKKNRHITIEERSVEFVEQLLMQSNFLSY